MSFSFVLFFPIQSFPTVTRKGNFLNCYSKKQSSGFAKLRSLVNILLDLLRNFVLVFLLLIVGNTHWIFPFQSKKKDEFVNATIQKSTGSRISHYNWYKCYVYDAHISLLILRVGKYINFNEIYYEVCHLWFHHVH